MKESDLIQIWHKLRQQLIFSQLAPTFLLIATIALLNDSLAETTEVIRYATLGILLASGIFGFLAQYSVATEARAVLTEVKNLPTRSAIGDQLVGFSIWLNIIRFLTPLIFVIIYVLLCIALLS